MSPPGPPAPSSDARMASSAAARRAAGSAISRIYSIPASYSPRVAVSSPRTNFHSGTAFPRLFGAMPEAPRRRGEKRRQRDIAREQCGAVRKGPLPFPAPAGEPHDKRRGEAEKRERRLGPHEVPQRQRRPAEGRALQPAGRGEENAHEYEREGDELVRQHGREQQRCRPAGVQEPHRRGGPPPRAKRRARPKTSAAISAPQSALSAPSAAAPPPSLTTSAS